MGLTIANRAVQRAAVVGCGNLGPDVALFLSRALAPLGIPVVVQDVSRDALEAGRRRILQKLSTAADSGYLGTAESQKIVDNIAFTPDRSLLVGCGLVVECVPEKLELKQALFEDLERMAPAQAILASSSGHLEPARLFEGLRRPERALIHHFFYPAERNPLVEIVAGTDPELAAACAAFYESVGKIPVRVGGRYGYAVNPVFEGLVLAALRLEEKGFPPAVIDAVACRTLRLTAGPFTVLNQTGGTAVLRDAVAEYARRGLPGFEVLPALEEKASTGQRWRTADKGETVSYSNAMFEEISRGLLGACFAHALDVLESGVASLGDLDLALEIGLGMRAPFTLMNELGPARTRELVEACTRPHPAFRKPASWGPWDIPVVFREDRGDVAVLTIRRPRVLNAVNADVCRQLDAHLAVLAEEPRIRGVVLTAFGTKAFCAGADAREVAALGGPEEARRYARDAHRALRRLERLGKPVVCALNGLSLGGGSEIAYACTVRIARAGLAVAFGHPEVRLGIIPGGGATQRLPRLIDFNLAWRLLRTGGSLSAEEALAAGLLHEVVEGDLLARAVELARTSAAAAPRAARPSGPPPEVDLRGLSRRIDEILRRAILQGAPLPLEQALEVESAAFAEAYATQDCRIGLNTYLRSGFKRSAPFVHA